MTTSSGRTTRILPTPTGTACFSPSPLLLPRVARRAANANALRTGDGVTGPTESAGDGGALLSLPSPPLPQLRDVNARAVGSRRCTGGEGLKTGAAGLSFVVVTVVVADARLSATGHGDGGDAMSAELSSAADAANRTWASGSWMFRGDCGVMESLRILFRAEFLTCFFFFLQQ